MNYNSWLLTGKGNIHTANNNFCKPKIHLFDHKLDMGSDKEMLPNKR